MFSDSMWRLRKCCKYRFGKNYSSTVPTIFALSSGQGKCGVAVIRVSGPKARESIFKMTKLSELPKPRMAVLRKIQDPETSEELDKGLVLWFPGPNSFTGEDSCEFQVHGGPAVIKSILTSLSKFKDFRPAEAGEFTKRAFYAGKLDLTEVEGLGDLIHAETNLQRKQALYQMEGNLGMLYKKWRKILVKNLAHIEAYIDFSEDENIEEGILKLASDELKQLKEEIKNHLTDGRKGEILRNGIQTTIIGEPNAGKSSLLNAICQKPAAIVTSKPGTTRDTIQMHINIGGFPITLTDTAGIRTGTTDDIEKEGISRAYATIDKSDLVLLVIDASRLTESSFCITQNSIQTFLQNHLKSLNLNAKFENLLKETNDDVLPKCICVFNKIDLLTEEQKIALKEATETNSKARCISCKTEEGFQTFINDASKMLQQLCGNPTKENPCLTQSRHRYHLNECLKFLNECFLFLNEDITLAAQKLRLSARHLGKIIGTVSSEEIIDVIFKSFCIGK